MYNCIVPEKEDKQLLNFSKRLPEIIFLVGLTAFLLVVGVYGVVDGEHTNSGTVGDTIGGTTAPIIGLLSAVLIYFSFKAQIRANEITREQSIEAIKQVREESNFRYLIEEFERVKSLVHNYENLLGAEVTETGSGALESFSKWIFLSKKDNPDIAKKSLLKTKYVLLAVENIFKEQRIPVSKDSRGILNSKLTRYFDENLSRSLSGIANWELKTPTPKSSDVDALLVEPKNPLPRPSEVDILLAEVQAGASRIIGLFNAIET